MSGRRAARAILSAAALIAAASAPRAAAPITWEYPGGAAAAAGSAEGVAVGADGSLVLSAPLREIFPAGSKLSAPPFVWSLASDPSGNLYLGSGNDGAIYRVDRKGASSSLLDTRELGVRGLAASVSGDLYAATFPTGAVYRIQADGKSEPWFEPEERYLWALAVDRAEHLYVATGERGVIYRVLGQGQGGVLFDSDESHITSLAYASSGDLFAGSSPDGLLYRIGPDGKASVVFDTDLREISGIVALPDGTLYVAAIGEESAPPPRRPGERSDFLIEVTPTPVGGVLEESSEPPRKITIDLADLLPPAPRGESGTAGRIYRIPAGGPPTLLWRSDIERPLSIAWTRERGVVFGTGGGTAGGIYSVDDTGRSSLLHRLREPQVTAMAAIPDGRIFAGTSYPGRVYQVDAGALSGGSYTSGVMDAGGAARWGTIGWDADVPEGTLVEIASRSGNRPAPDATWSDWSASYPHAEGSAIVSPPGRYLQWRATLGRARTESSPVLRAVRTTVLPQNIPPMVRSVKVLPPGAKTAPPAAPPAAVAAAPADPPAPGAVEPPKGQRWVSWTTDDPDGDATRSTLLLRRIPDGEEKRLAEGIAAPPWSLDDASLAEGSYRIRVESSDAAANGIERGLSASAESLPFQVDHTPPKLSLRALPSPVPGAAGTEILASDTPGRIDRAEFSRGGDGSSGWTALPCRDGICDTGKESFLVPAAEGSASQKVTVRVFDAAGNVATIEPGEASRRPDR